MLRTWAGDTGLHMARGPRKTQRLYSAAGAVVGVKRLVRIKYKSFLALGITTNPLSRPLIGRFLGVAL